MQDIEEHIREVTARVCRAVLGWRVTVPADQSADRPGEPALAGWTAVTGAWEGVVALRCSAVLVRRAAGALFRVDPDATTEAQRRDVLGELTNMTAGTLKGLFPGPSHLSPPVVSETVDSIRADHPSLVGEVAFACEGHVLVVSVLQRDARTAPVAG